MYGYNEKDREHLIQMVDYIKTHPELQVIVIVLRLCQPRLTYYIKYRIKLFYNIYPGSNFWDHVAVV